MSVLVVDDHAAMREVLVEWLASEGFAAVSASSGPEALRFLETTRPEAVVLDVQMRGMDGLAVLGEIRGKAALKGLPVILFTMAAGGDGGAAIQERARALGADACVDKAAGLEALLREIRRVTGRPGDT